MQRLDAATGVQYFTQTANIDLSGQSWMPFYFGGHFDGNGKTISNVKISNPSNDYVGFFSKLSTGGELIGIKLENVDVLGYEYVGGLVGFADGSISNSYASGSVSGTSNVGGLVGVTYSSISNSYASGSVSGTSNVGGLVGWNDGRISNSYALGSVTGTSSVGGLVGVASGSISSSYYDSETSNQSDTGKGIPRTTAEMKTGTPSETIYTGWDLAIWDFGTSSDYPTLRK